jgi:hypothetical protein
VPVDKRYSACGQDKRYGWCLWTRRDIVPVDRTRDIVSACGQDKRYS